jgi:precorrin-6Y C5,15-methyltransferase (decarboxylating)
MAVKKARLLVSANTVTVVGMGMSPEDLSNKALTLIKEADILIGGKRHLDYFPKFPARKVPISKNLKAILNVINTSLTKKKKVVVIASGDPGYYGIASYLISHLGKERVTIMPNITTFQAAFAKIKESWDDAYLLSLHGRPIPQMAHLLKRYKKVGILTDNTNNPSRIAKSILSEDPSLKATSVFILEKLGTEEEEIHLYPLNDIIKKSFLSLSAMILISPTRDKGREGEKIHLGIPDALFSHKGGLITKDDIRIFTLAKLNLPKRGVFWDIGSGSGSIAIEAALLAPELEIFAIEKYDKRIKDIKKNISRFHTVKTITPVLGEAPQTLKILPKPNRIFIGGTEGKLIPILRYCKRVLLPSGKVVINASTIETVNGALLFFEKTGWSSAVSLVNISKMKKIGDQKRFQPLNPVFVIEGRMPEDGGKLMGRVS